MTLTDTGEDSELVHRRKRPKVDTLFFSFFRRVRATSMTQRRVEKYSRPLLDRLRSFKVEK